jgi:hypothetical protein
VVGECKREIDRDGGLPHTTFPRGDGDDILQGAADLDTVNKSILL